VPEDRESASVQILHFFHGHEIEPGSYFAIRSANGMEPVTVSIVEITDTAAQAAQLESPGARYALEIAPGIEDPSPRRLILSEKGTVTLNSITRLRRAFGAIRREESRIVFIAPDFMSHSLPAMWDQVLLERQEGDIRKAMQILDPSIEDIVFQTGDPMSRNFDRSSSGRSGVLASFAGGPRRIPLGSMGDGMHRLLTLAICLKHARGGYLFIDEIDTGLHYSIMAKMWELVVRTAIESNTQVFATTHSADCVRGLGVLCKSNPDLQEHVSAHKIERELDAGVALTGADVLNAIEQDIEIR
jgi:hypothetical protein